MSKNTIPSADWEVSDNEAFAPALNNVDDKSKAEQEKARYEQDTKHRSILAYWVIWVTSSWLVCVIVILILNGCSVLEISDIVLNVLLATTTANILGLPYIVLKGLFGSK